MEQRPRTPTDQDGTTRAKSVVDGETACAFVAELVGECADRGYRRTPASRFWVAAAGLLFGAPCIFFLGAAPTLALTRVASIAFGFFIGFVSGNQAPCAFDVVPAPLRASTTGVLNLAGASVSGFAPFLGGLSRRTIGVDRLMSFTALLFLIAGVFIIYAIRRHFDFDHRRSLEESGIRR